MSSSGRVIIPVLIIVSAFLVCCGNKARNRAMVVKNEAVVLYERGNYTGALRRLSEAVSIDPNYGEAYYIMGMIRLNQYDSPQTAIPDLERAADLMPEHAPSYYLLGTAYLFDGDYGLAKEKLSLALEHDPEHARAFYRLGVAHEALGEIIEAIEAYSQSVHADPRFPQPYERLGNIYSRYDFIDEAIAVFEQAVEHCGDANSANNLGRMYQRKGEVEAALQYFRRAVELAPDSVAYNYNLGVAYAESYSNSRDPQDRDRAAEFLTIAGDRCAQLESQARCNEIRQSLVDLTEPETP